MVKTWKNICGMMALLLLGGVAQACEIQVHDARLRLPPPMSDTAAAYMVLQNGCADTRVLVSITSPWAKMVMMHNAAMQAMPKLVLQAGERVVFQPRSKHIMLMGVHQHMQVGVRVPLVLHWKNGSTQTVHAVVQDMRLLQEGE